MQRDIEVLATTRERGVVGSFEINIDQRQNRPQEALRLTKRQLEDKAQRQSCLDRVVGELPLCTTRPVGAGFQDAMASSEIHRVILPRWTRAQSYSGQLFTRYFVLYLG